MAWARAAARMESLLRGMAERLDLFATPQTDRISVGIGGDIPIFPPFVAFSCVVIGNILMKRFVAGDLCQRLATSP